MSDEGANEASDADDEEVYDDSAASDEYNSEDDEAGAVPPEEEEAEDAAGAALFEVKNAVDASPQQRVMTRDDCVVVRDLRVRATLLASAQDIHQAVYLAITTGLPDEEGDRFRTTVTGWRFSEKWLQLLEAVAKCENFNLRRKYTSPLRSLAVMSKKDGVTRLELCEDTVLAWLGKYPDASDIFRIAAGMKTKVASADEAGRVTLTQMFGAMKACDIGYGTAFTLQRGKPPSFVWRKTVNASIARIRVDKFCLLHTVGPTLVEYRSSATRTSFGTFSDKAAFFSFCFACSEIPRLTRDVISSVGQPTAIFGIDLFSLIESPLSANNITLVRQRIIPSEIGVHIAWQLADTELSSFDRRAGISKIGEGRVWGLVSACPFVHRFFEFLASEELVEAKINVARIKQFVHIYLSNFGSDGSGALVALDARVDETFSVLARRFIEPSPGLSLAGLDQV